MYRDDLWFIKSWFPVIFRGIFENTMLPGTITEAFRRCGILPVIPDDVDNDSKRNGEIPGQDISDDNTKNEPPCLMKGAFTTMTVLPDDGIEVQLEVIEDMPGNAELFELDSGIGDTKLCLPALALHAIEATDTKNRKLMTKSTVLMWPNALILFTQPGKYLSHQCNQKRKMSWWKLELHHQT